MHWQLQRHEVVCKFTAYLQWAVKDYVPGGKKKHRTQEFDADPDTNEQAPNDDIDDSPATINSLLTSTTLLQHHIAKNPPFTMPLNTINSKFGVHLFAETLEKFLHESDSLHPSLPHAIENAQYPVFKQFTVQIPSLPQVTSVIVMTFWYVLGMDLTFFKLFKLYFHLGLIMTPHVFYVHMTYVYFLFSCFTFFHTITWPREVIVVL